jgi:hypothetical protein
VKEVYEQHLRSLAEDPRFASSVSPELRRGVPINGMETAHLHTSIPLVSYPSLPQGVVLSGITQQGKPDFETLKTLAQKFILPFIRSTYPGAKPYVTGIEFIWASKEFWDAISDEKVDAVKSTTKGVNAAQKALKAALLLKGPAKVNMIGGCIVAAAGKLYAAR